MSNNPPRTRDQKLLVFKRHNYAHRHSWFDAGYCRNATWISKILPVVEGPPRHIAEAWLWLIYRLGLCCTFVGRFALYLGGTLMSHPNLNSMYTIYYPHTLSSEIVVLLQMNHKPAFSIGGLDFLFESFYSIPGDNIFYNARYGGETIIVRIACVDCYTLWPAI
jgi:hypothetical protein